ncbi:MAG: gamma-glutamyltransferase, partial [Intestinibacter sp.]|uniref:gamma-glutamyltransferase n=1 Tax=Intestinibacter sp. TaxID=1965304 RepID=UPI003F15B958
MKISKKIISVLLVLTLTIPMCVGCAKTVKEESENTEESKKIIAEAKEKLKEVEEDKDSTGIVKDGEGWTLWDEDGNLTSGGRDATGKNGVVATAKYEASQAGLEVLEAGGNAIDAAVAVAFALSVVEPNGSGIGGGGSMIIRTAEGENVFIAFRGDAPAAATPYMWVVSNGKVANKEERQGGKAVSIPGEVAGLLYAFDKYGSKNVTLEEVMAPAINLAQNGFYVTPTLYHDIVAADEKMSRFDEFYKFLRKDDGELYQVGDLWKNEDLADTLRIIAKEGRDGFYKGEVAEKIVEMANKYGGILTLDDLANYEPNVSTPVEGTYRGYKILSSQAGGTSIIEALNILENFDMSKYDIDSAERIHLLSEAMKISYADREEYMADPFNQDVPIKGLTSKKYAKKLAEQINMDYSQNYSSGDAVDYEHEDTTHFSVADKDGNMVAITQTVNLEFGSG